MRFRAILIRYGGAVAAVAGAVLVQAGLDAVAGMSQRFIIVFLAVVVSAWWGGWGPGILATLLAGCFAAVFWLRPIGDPLFEQIDDWASLLAFAVSGVAVSAISHSMHAARARAEQAAATALEATEEEKRMATELRQVADKLELTNQAKDEFLSILGHELRNPLASIVMGTEVLSQFGALNERQKRAVEIVSRQTHNIDDILDVSRAHRGRLTMKHETVDLTGLVENCLAEFRGTRAVNHELSWTLEKLWVVGDPTRLEQILANLVVNAVKYTPEGGHIQVSLNQVDQQAVLRVEDDGVGIASELLPDIFEPFVQSRDTLDRSAGGLGIGLALVKRLAELHGGSAEAFSAGRSHGSQFAVSFPAVPAP
jgi:signal transduction histidine kinase